MDSASIVEALMLEFFIDAGCKLFAGFEALEVKKTERVKIELVIDGGRWEVIPECW
jgi:hypothetical protein